MTLPILFLILLCILGLSVFIAGLMVAAKSADDEIKRLDDGLVKFDDLLLKKGVTAEEAIKTRREILAKVEERMK